MHLHHKTTGPGRSSFRLRTLAMFISLLLLPSLLLAAAVMALVTFSVSPSGETDPHIGNADDPAIWVHPTDPSQSVVIGTFKSRGLILYDLDGTELGTAWDDDMNNVDLRYNFPLDGELVDLVIATSPPANTLFMYRVDPATRSLVNVTGVPVASTMSQVYGFCMYRSPGSDLFYAIITGDLGEIEQYELVDGGAGKVDAKLVRSFSLGTITEGCVADDEHQTLYIGQEDVALWKFGAEPDSGSTGIMVDTVGAGGHLTKDIEGVTIYHAGDGDGYLLVSSQGSSDFAVYERLGDNAYITRFNIVAGNGYDDATQTDGIDVINMNLGGQYSQGLFVAHDNADDVIYNNFKYVPWNVIATTANPPLNIDTSWDPRTGAQPPTAAFSTDVTSGTAPLTVSFTDESTGAVASWLWAFGDTMTATVQHPLHVYTAPGSYDISLTVSNTAGADTVFESNYIVVTDDTSGAVTADFAADMVQGPAPLAVNFANLATGPFTACAWSFGDGATDDSCGDVTHIYQAAGTYDVSLTVMGAAAEDSEEKPAYVTVLKGVDELLPVAYLPLLVAGRSATLTSQAR